MAPSKDRVVRSRGPIIRLLEIGIVVTALLAAVALLFAIALFSRQVDANRQRLNFVQQSREASAQDSCQVLRNLVTDAFTPERRVRALRLLDKNGLGDCTVYAQKAVRSANPFVPGAPPTKAPQQGPISP